MRWSRRWYAPAVATFTVGEEVLYDDERFVIAGISITPPYYYRLLATGKRGAKVVWAVEKELEKIRAYTESKRD